jgi:hypothetical protein
MSWKYLALAIAAVFGFAHEAVGAEIIPFWRARPACDPQIEVCHLIIKIQGEIAPADSDRLKQLIEQTRQEGERKHWEMEPPFVYLDTPGGNVSAAMAIGRLLRNEEGSVQIETQAICYSACVIVLAGAVSRYIQGQVGIHRPYYEVPKGEISRGKITEAFKSTLQELRAYFREMNVNEELADAMLRIEPEHMRLLNYAELNRYGLTGIDPIAKEVKELKAAQNLGITRQEYMRRKALVQTRCASPSTFCAQKIMQTGEVDPSVSPDQEDFSQYGRPLKTQNEGKEERSRTLFETADQHSGLSG